MDQQPGQQRAGPAGTGFEGSVAQAYANQVAYCEKNGTTVTGRIVAAVGALLDDADAGAFIARIRDWPGVALADAVPLRSIAGLHALHLSGTAPELAPVYAPVDGGEPVDVPAIVRDVVRRRAADLLPWLDGPPQTNEAGRSAGFVAAMLWLAGRGLPARFECLEIGSSAGINLMLDRYRYDLGGVTVGPDQPAMRFAPEWRGAPPPDGPIAIAATHGCDVAPLDLTDPADALRLRAFVWPEQAERAARIDAAVATAKLRPPRLERLAAADFVERELAQPQAAGTTRVLMHSIVMQYVPPDQRARIEAAMAAAGARADETRALAWIALEADRGILAHTLRVHCWPDPGGHGGAEHLLATAHAHGAWLDWRGPDAQDRTDRPSQSFSKPAISAR